MSILTLLHAIVAGALFCGAAWCAEAGLRRLGLPARGIWLLAISATLLTPLGAPTPGALIGRLQGDGATGFPGMILSAAASVAEGPDAAPALTPLNRARPWIPVGWSILALAGVACVAGGLRRLQRQARRWPPARVGDEPVLVSPDFGPAVLGLRRSVVVLPSWALSLPPAEVELIVRHEAAHRSSHDPRLLALGVVLAALAPWNPALWFAVRRLREAVEKDCDRRLIREGTDRLAYARMLVSMRGRGGGGRHALPLPVPALADTPDSLERRLKTMWIAPSPRPAVAALLAAGALLVVACESPSPTVTRAEPVQDLQLDAAGALVEVEGTAQAPDPLIVVDGEIHEGAVSLLAPEEIERIEVLKGPAALSAYGEAGADGVVSITTRAAARAWGEPSDSDAGAVSIGASEARSSGTVRIRARPSTGAFRVDPLPEAEEAEGVLRRLEVSALEGAVVLIDGVEAEDGIPTSLRPEDIDRVEVIKGEAATRLHGPRAVEGVIRITTKKGGG